MEMTDDLISRQDTLQLFETAFENNWTVSDTMDALKNLPSAQPERKKGEWIDYTDEGYVECPFCHSATNCDDNIDELHFCFLCGAEMRGENNGGKEEETED